MVLYLCSVMILSFLFYCFLAYLAFKLLFNFIIPVVKTTRQVKKSFREMHEKMQGTGSGPDPKAGQPSAKGAANSKSSDYIDFEEIKD